MCGLLENLLDFQKVVAKQNGFHGPAFPSTRGKTQGGLVYLTLFNVVVDNVIRTWLDMTVEDQSVYHDVMGDTVGRCLRVFYADDGMVVSCDSDWLKHTMNVPVGLFRSYGLVANVTKSHTMTCQTGALWAGMSEEDMAMNCTGVGDSY